MTRLPLHTTAFTGIALGAIVAAELAWLVVVPVPAFPHQLMSGQVYPGFCCQGTAGVSGHGDCAPIPASDVQETAEGWVITIKPGDHPLATRGHVFKRAYSNKLPSTDGQYHLCLYPTEDKDQCFLAPPEGS